MRGSSTECGRAVAKTSRSKEKRRTVGLGVRVRSLKFMLL